MLRDTPYACHTCLPRVVNIESHLIYVRLPPCYESQAGQAVSDRFNN